MRRPGPSVSGHQEEVSTLIHRNINHGNVDLDKDLTVNTHNCSLI